MRSTLASHQAMSETVGRGLQELLGHREGRMTARYTHLSNTYLKAAVNGLHLGAKQRPSHENGTHLALASEASKG